MDGIYKTYRNTGKLVEFYDPDRFDFKELSRKKGNLYKQLTLGGKPRPNFVGWTGLCNTLLIEDLMGIRKEGGRFVMAPNFPDEAEGSTFHLVLPGVSIEAEARVMAEGHFEVIIKSRGEEEQASGARGDKFNLVGGPFGW